LTLGVLIKRLERIQDKTKSLVFDDGRGLGEAMSYRGCYEYLAFGSADSTVGEAIERATEAIGKTYIGYKGGEYMMDKDTLVFRAEFGCCGKMVIGIREHDDRVIIVTQDEVW
jgi:hypothetical protein